MSKVIRGILALISLLNPRTWGPFLNAWDRTKFDHDFSVSYSQGGEDLALLQLLKKTNGRYLDIGAHHPDRFSNTRLLYDRGWSGVNVEANPSLISAFNERRPRDLTLWACVGSEKEFRFTIFQEPALSTSNKDWKEKFLSESQEIFEEIEVKGVTLHELIVKYFHEGDLDLLLVDAEGSDFDVISSGNFGDLPRNLLPNWIVVETPRPVEAALNEATVRYLQDHGYIVWAVLSMSTVLQKTS
jgi:FkbM family methyltransferase